jgi:hypothetical protein
MTDEPETEVPPGPPRSASEIPRWVEILNKLAVPLLAAFATIGGTWLSLYISERNNLRETLNQREQAESSLRSTMFSQLVNPMLDQAMEDCQQRAADGTCIEDEAQQKARQRERADRITLLAELLALNFHEHFELGPLLRYVDRLPNQTADNRNRLRSVSRKVVGRQIASLGRNGVGSCASGDGSSSVVAAPVVEVWLSSTAEDAARGRQTCYVDESSDGVAAHMKCVRWDTDLSALDARALVVRSPDCRDEFELKLFDLDWDTQTIAASAEPPPGAKRGAQASSVAHPVESYDTVDFTVSPYSLPYSDNTLLRSGNRFGLYIRRIEPRRIPCRPPNCDPTTVKLLLYFVWFPKDFFPPLERPTNFGDVRKALKIQPEERQPPNDR